LQLQIIRILCANEAAARASHRASSEPKSNRKKRFLANANPLKYCGDFLIHRVVLQNRVVWRSA
jgi:hypothetical protein